MLFLHSKGIPTNGHVHSGNIFVKKGVCRISGYEQAILGFKSRLYPRLSKALKKKKYAIDTLCFGHLLYEMSYGQELFDAKPGKLHFEFCSRSVEVGEILKFVFGADESPYPSLEEILYHRFFHEGDGLDPIDPDSIFFKPQVTRNVLKPFNKYFKKMQRKSGKDRSEIGKEAQESPDISKESGRMDRNFTVSYEAETESISNPILRKQAFTSSNDGSSSPPHIPSSPSHIPSASAHIPSAPPPPPAMFSKSTENQREKQLDESADQPRNEPAALFGVEALMDSIKQAIEKHHNTLENSDEASSRRSSFSSASPPISPAPLDVSGKSQSSNTKPTIPSKPALAMKPSIPPKPTLRDVQPPQVIHKAPPPAPKPPPALPSESDSDHQTNKGSARSELLKSIVQGSKLRTAVTNDRSAPRV